MQLNSFMPGAESTDSDLVDRSAWAAIPGQRLCPDRGAYQAFIASDRLQCDEQSGNKVRTWPRRPSLRPGGICATWKSRKNCAPWLCRNRPADHRQRSATPATRTTRTPPNRWSRPPSFRPWGRGRRSRPHPPGGGSPSLAIAGADSRRLPGTVDPLLSRGPIGQTRGRGMTLALSNDTVRQLLVARAQTAGAACGLVCRGRFASNRFHGQSFTVSVMNVAARANRRGQPGAA